MEHCWQLQSVSSRSRLLCSTGRHCSSWRRTPRSWSAHPWIFIYNAPVISRYLQWPVNVCLLHQAEALILRHLLAEVHHHVLQLRPRDVAVTVLEISKSRLEMWRKLLVIYYVKHSECFSNLILSHESIQLAGHHWQEGRKSRTHVKRRHAWLGNSLTLV